MSEMMLITIIGVVSLIGLAYYLMVWIDIPFRNYLKKKPLDNSNRSFKE
jgi:hypothetical protein